ncbi:major facilitator superfamily domain-containing protein [Naematelia encephala]|uniref:Major facilitator superfamily domain-containing protein n=1 Tax=Naematelia encephala TaxID=71784 RepID=A0A1Y2AUE9_9TREE|nr:major facilitator superfamily domain-containing protein [Naematelia encephala]
MDVEKGLVQDTGPGTVSPTATAAAGRSDSQASRDASILNSETETESVIVPETARQRGRREEIQLQDQTNLLPLRQVIVVFVGLSCALFCSLLDQTIVSTALPTIGQDFEQADIVSWVGTSYLLTSTAFQPMSGRLSDIFGRKVVLSASLLVFLVGTTLCAVAQSMTQLIAFRALAGIGGGGMMTLIMVIASDVVPLKERGKYQGILGGIVAAANSAGPLLGGVLSEKLTWRWCFYINLPLTVLSILVVTFLLPLKRVHGGVRRKLKQIDYLGCALTLIWTILVLLPLSWAGQQMPWSSVGVILPLALGGICLVLFCIVEWRFAHLPIVPMSLFANMTFLGAQIATFFSGMMFYTSLYYLPLYFQVIWGSSPLRSGILLLPLILTQTVTSFTTGLIVSKTGDYKINLMIGYLLWAIGSGLLATIDENTSLGKLVGFQILTGIGAGQTFQTGLIAVQASVAQSEMAVATGARNFFRLLGGTISLAVCAAILNGSLRSVASLLQRRTNGK